MSTQALLRSFDWGKVVLPKQVSCSVMSTLATLACLSIVCLAQAAVMWFLSHRPDVSFRLFPDALLRDSQGNPRPMNPDECRRLRDTAAMFAICGGLLSVVSAVLWYADS
jgi:hypothetical protein